MALAMAAAWLPGRHAIALIFGVPVWTTTHGGYTLALANNEVYYRDVLNGSPGAVWTGRRPVAMVGFRQSSHRGHARARG